MASSLHASTVSCPLDIYGITIDFRKSKKNVESTEVCIGKLHSPIEHEAGRVLRHTFSLPMYVLDPYACSYLSCHYVFFCHRELSHPDTFSLHVRYKKWYVMKHEDVFRMCNASERQEYIKVHKRFTIAVNLSGNTTIEQTERSGSSDQSLELRPTTSEIFRKCPRFRILVIGNTGVGKSSLINHAFGVEKTIASHDKPGEASIDHEFISPQNDKFVLHDSKGFEPRDEDNLRIVRDSIERRRNMSTPEHQLHAIWLCFEIPRADARLLETGMEEFLTLKSNGTLGNIPIVAVLTKYDKLIDRMERTLDETSLNGLSDEAIKELAKNKTEAELQDICIGPLKKIAGPDIPHAKISTHKGYKETLANLIQITEDRVSQHSAPEAAVMTSIAQRVHPGLKIKASIEILEGACIKHDIQEPQDVGLSILLARSRVQRLMVKMIDGLDVEPIANPTKTITIGLSTVVAVIAGIVSALSGPAAPILVPIAASAVLAKWFYDVYQISVIKLAVASYLASPMSGEVYTRIQEYDGRLTILERAD
ncbi:hypothetical protein BDR04DRAFT_1145644 [Suillus decipiens]|nr:hypothetical protein BDR04DRAFT_1145644 [Suillus decipiens]